ncbi:MAG: tRNA lysidine(34) synthetase TilS [Lentisphaeria bacterium]|nr:tRNA lysidine(34) synthetase TilS [Lentisphaeria bacterium]
MRTDDLQAIFSSCRNFRVWAGFSGGADSTAALLLAHDAAKRVGFDLTAVHFHHHLRGKAADDEAENAAKFARKLGVKFLRRDLRPAPGPGMEARARELRLAVWRELAGNRPDAAVVLGHHRDDRVENLFLRLARGSGSGGLTGLRPDTVVFGVRFLRPLYMMRREEVEAFLRSRGVTRWAEDASNRGTDTFRNRLRNRLLPEFYAAHPGCREAVAQALETLTLEAEFLDAEAAARLESSDPAAVDFWRQLPPALLGRALRKFLSDRGGTDLPVNRQGLRRFQAAVAAGGSRIVPLDGGRTVRLSGGRVLPDAPVPPDVRWHWRREAVLRWGNWRFTAELTAGSPEGTALDAACFDPESLPETLSVGAPRDGETMRIFGTGREVKIKTLRVDRNVPAFPAPPVLRDPSGRALWLPGIRHSALHPVRPGGGCLRIFGEKLE